MLMPPDLRDWVSDDHLVWSIRGPVDEMDLSSLYAYARGNRVRWSWSSAVSSLLRTHDQRDGATRQDARVPRERRSARLPVLAGNGLTPAAGIDELQNRQGAEAATLVRLSQLVRQQEPASRWPALMLSDLDAESLSPRRPRRRPLSHTGGPTVWPGPGRELPRLLSSSIEHSHCRIRRQKEQCLDGRGVPLLLVLTGVPTAPPKSAASLLRGAASVSVLRCGSPWRHRSRREIRIGGSGNGPAEAGPRSRLRASVKTLARG